MRYWYPLGRTRWFGARLHVHLSVIAVTVLVVLTARDNPAFASVTLLSLLGVILLHELGHAAVAYHFGYEVESIWLAVVHGRCVFETPATEWERSIIAWGGVIAQLVVAVPIIILDSVWHHSLGVLGPVVLILGYYSCVVALFNLIPIQGLDGPLAWGIIPLLRKRVEARRVVRRALGRNRNK